MRIFLRKRTHRLKSGLSAFLALALLWSLSPGSWPVLADAAGSSLAPADSAFSADDIFGQGEGATRSGLTFYLNNKGCYRFLDGSVGQAISSQYQISGSNASALQWVVISLAGDYYSFQSPVTGRYLSDGNATIGYAEMVTASESSLPEKCKWQVIALGNDYYQIKNKVTGKSLKRLESPTSFADVVMTSETMVTDYMKWKVIVSSSYVPRTSIGCEDVTIEKGYTCNFTSLPVTVNPSATFAADLSSYDITIADTSIVSRGSATLRGENYGSVSVTLQCLDTTAACVFTVTVPEHPFAGIVPDMAYTLQNCASWRYLSLSGATEVTGTAITTTTDKTLTQAHWTLDNIGNGVFEIRTEYGSGTKCMRLNGEDFDLYPDGNLSNQRFTLIRIDESNNTGDSDANGLYAIMYGDKYLSQGSDGSLNLITGTAPHTCWSICAVDKGTADLYSMQYTGFNTTANNDRFESIVGGAGYTAEAHVGDTPTNAYVSLCEDDIFVFRGHGNAGLIGFHNTSGTTLGAIAVNSYVASGYFIGSDRKYLQELDVASLSHLRCVLYIGCSTGVNYGSYNLVDETFGKGAHFVLGTTETVYTHDSNDFLLGFLEQLQQGGTIEDCFENGLRKVGDAYCEIPEHTESHDYPIIYLGNKYQELS